MHWLAGPLRRLQVYNRRGWCQLFSYATYVTSFLSVWFVVSFSFERYLTIQFPLKRHVLCRPRRARLVVLSMTALALLLYNFALWTSVVQPLPRLNLEVCQVRPPQWRHQGGKLPLYGCTSENYVICVYMCVLNAFIVMELLRITRQIHCKAVEQKATLIHRQYNRDWGTSYSRPPMDAYLTSPLLQNPGGATGPSIRLFT